ncbi:folate-binding protein YgfZ [Marinimicrobium sp. ABcell2]|uniref:CAF17-like 4Fe-4S cluster assembly/insertion protein YgfZ n=1 Tax=Marinimicrobium sp. ABcell2 TaxID=3069751 RepID=UPI0027AFAC96|nr:hypothetical protein [Marinimicrobium sp. ABcell2]MDQ2075272.1 hypothetical protein [Marinimicrobium sp. ABcell2]
MQQNQAQRTAPTFLVRLEHQGLLSVEGPDAGKFLQGQLTCDVRELVPNHSQLGAQCNLQGRMMSTFRLLQDREDRFILRMADGLLEPTLAALNKYIVFSKASLRNLTDDYTQVGVVGPQARALLSACIGGVPEQDGDWLEDSGHLIIRLGENRYECWLEAQSASPVLAQLASHCQPGDQNLWTLQDIRAGWAEVQPNTREIFTPQALNYPLVGGVSFRKGCYTGQEVVARLHYKGKLKRHMYRVGFSWPEQAPLPEPGDTLAGDGEREVLGQCILAARGEDGMVEALVVMNDSTTTREDLEFKRQKLRLLPLPYAIPKGD